MERFDLDTLHEREMIRRLARVLQEIWAIEVQRCLALSLSLDAVPEELEQAVDRRRSAETQLLRAESRLRLMDALISRQAAPPQEAPSAAAPRPNTPPPTVLRPISTMDNPKLGGAGGNAVPRSGHPAGLSA
jgi:hypothetical protein